jgi:hypothetical protein
MEYVFTWAGWEGPCVVREKEAAAILAYMAGFLGWFPDSVPPRQVIAVSIREFRA